MIQVSLKARARGNTSTYSLWPYTTPRFQIFLKVHRACEDRQVQNGTLMDSQRLSDRMARSLDKTAKQRCKWCNNQHKELDVQRRTWTTPKLLRSKNQKTGRRTEVPPLNRGSPVLKIADFALWKPLFKPDEVADEWAGASSMVLSFACSLTIKEDRDVTPEDFDEDLSSLPGLSFDSEANSAGAVDLEEDKRAKAALLGRNDLLTVDTALPPPLRVNDYGKPIYYCSSRAALLAWLQAVLKDNNPSWRAFLIDLDLAIKKRRDESSGAQGKTGTRARLAPGAFMAIGVLLRRLVFPDGRRWKKPNSHLYLNMIKELRHAQKNSDIVD
ncbi:uncharacterized protein PADG_02042 [Paracoccidioides brasiliensis Pb18]|uniref:Fungal-type protein kinase domain-containing protein n=1 Tax=Paracoccidioides brasiliensis (strain Pb18) TaxID=502780 RepID=C1G526_PARBD|nr:uncharacterized protein PADG_02042 [Paracoccidioides brasiliensis Pb18]EEH45892.2 hypothetical protein PADG_02042 [Paracoccidioides brasiliensis Pb18]